MSWIVIDRATPNKPEIAKMASRLSVSENEILGACLNVWLWVDEQASVTDRDARVCAECAQLDIIARHAGIADALVSVGWLAVKDGMLVFPRFARYHAQTLKARALTAARNRAYRQRQRDARVTLRRDARVTLRRDAKVTPTQHNTVETASAVSATARKPNPVWDAIVALWFATGVSKSQQTRIGKLARDFAAKSDFSPDELRKRRDRIAAAWGSEKATPEAVEKHWGEFAPSTATPKPGSAAQREQQAREAEDSEAIREWLASLPAGEAESVQAAACQTCRATYRDMPSDCTVTPTRPACRSAIWRERNRRARDQVGEQKP